MMYKAIIRKRVRYVRVYNILNRIGPKPNLVTRAIMGLVSKLSPKKGGAIR